MPIEFSSYILLKPLNRLGQTNLQNKKLQQPHKNLFSTVVSYSKVQIYFGSPKFNTTNSRSINTV